MRERERKDERKDERKKKEKWRQVTLYFNVIQKEETHAHHPQYKYAFYTGKYGTLRTYDKRFCMKY